MGRRAEGWRIRRKPEPDGPFYVRFRHAGTRHELATGSSDPGEATRSAAKIYADVVGGKVRVGLTIAAPDTPTEDLFVSWLDATANTRSAGTLKTWEVYARTFLKFFVVAADFTEVKIETWVSQRLGVVLRGTVTKELSALKHFLRWCVRAGFMIDAPVTPELEPGVLGTRTGKRKAKHTAHDPAIVEALLSAMPEWSRAEGQRRFAVRAYYRVLWETGLRPATVQALSVPEHYKRGAYELAITRDIDKVRFERPVPLRPEARAALDAVAPHKGIVFGVHDSRRYLRDAARAIGLDDDDVKAICGYDLRHSRTTDLLERSANLPGVAYLVGHKRVSTTNTYAHANIRAARAALGLLGDGSGETIVSGQKTVDLKGIEPSTSRVRCIGSSQESAIHVRWQASEIPEKRDDVRALGELPPKGEGNELPGYARSIWDWLDVADNTLLLEDGR